MLVGGLLLLLRAAAAAAVTLDLGYILLLSLSAMIAAITSLTRRTTTKLMAAFILVTHIVLPIENVFNYIPNIIIRCQPKPTRRQFYQVICRIA